METKKTNKISRSYFSEVVMKKAEDISNKKNKLSALAVLLLNICLIAIAWVIESNKNGCESLKNVFEGFDWKYLWIIFAFIFLSYLIKAFVDFLALYSKTKQRRFGTMLIGNIQKDYYNGNTMFSSGGYNVYALRLKNSNIDERLAVDISYGKKLINNISQVIYVFVVLVLGCCFVFDKSVTWIFVFAVIGFIITIGVLLFVLYFDKTKYGYLKFVGGLSKNLYSMKLIKDYELFYSQLIDKLVVYNASLKNKKAIVISQIVFGILNIFIRHVLLYVLLVSLNGAGSELFLSVLFKMSMYEMVLKLWLLPKGLLINELLFIALFRNVFFGGYVLWGMLLFRLFDYFLNIVIYFCIKIFESVVLRIKKNK